MKKLMKFIICAFFALCLTSCFNNKDKTYIVDFNTDGGSIIENQEVKANELVKKPADPTKVDYEFAGWFKDKACTEEYDFNTPVVKSITLYAKWNKLDIITIKFETNGGTAIKDVTQEKGTKLVKPADPTKEEHIFKGWFKNEKCTLEFDFDEEINENITIYAKWEQIVYVENVEMGLNFVKYFANKSEKENKRTEFFDLTKTFMVGSDNAFNAKPNVSYMVYDVELEEFIEIEVSEWKFNIKVTLLENPNLDVTSYIESIDYINCTIDFSKDAIGKKFEIEIYPEGLTKKQLSKVEVYTTYLEVEVVDGYNVYDALDFAYFENRTEGDEAAAWTEFKNSKGLDVNYHPKNLILQQDINIESTDLPSIMFYTESELSKADTDYERTLGSMKDYYDLYGHVLSENEEFHVYGNYYTLSASNLREVTRESGKITEVGEVVSHATLLRFTGSDVSASFIENINLIGNAPKVEDVIKSGGIILVKVNNSNFTAYNNIATRFFISYFPNYTLDTFTVSYCKAYNNFNSFIYNWGSNKVYIENSEMISAGGPIIIQDHVDPTSSEGGRIAETVFRSCKLESFITGQEGWFTIMKTTAIVPLIRSLNNFFLPFGRSFIVSNNGLEFMNLICVNKSGNAQTFTSEKIAGKLQIDDTTPFDFGASNPYLKAMLDNTFGKTAAFQTNAATTTTGFCYTPDGASLKDVLGNSITDPTNDMFKGDYLAIYYNGMCLTFGYYQADYTA